MMTRKTSRQDWIFFGGLEDALAGKEAKFPENKHYMDGYSIGELERGKGKGA